MSPSLEYSLEILSAYIKEKITFRNYFGTFAWCMFMTKRSEGVLRGTAVVRVK